MKVFTKRRIISAAVIIAVIVVPFLYSYFYLGAFWDPYSKLDTLPVAIVNNDKGAEINGTQRNLGNEMCDKLKEDNTLKFIFTDEKKAKEGTEGKEYYAMITIPEDFSSNIASASTEEKKTATISFSPNEKRNYLASQILNRAVLQIEEETRSSVNKEIVQELTDNLKGVPGQLTDLKDGLGELKDGSSKLKDGTATLKDGTATFKNKFKDFKVGINSAKEGAAQISEGANSLNDGLNALSAGADQIVSKTTNVDQLTTGAQQLAAGAQNFDSSLTQYTTGVDGLIASVGNTSSFLKQYVTKNPSVMLDPAFAKFITQMSDPANAKNIATLQDASTKLKAASAQIKQGTALLSTNTQSLPELKTALATLSAGVAQAKEGSAALEQGAASLNNGMNDISSATTKLSNAAGDIAKGASDLNNGTKKLNDGIATAKSGVDTAITDSNKELKNLDGLAEYAENPVKVEQNNVTSIENYGTAFAPYFMSLSLWVGALILFVGIYLDTEGKFKILSRDSGHKVARSFLFLVIGFAQAIALALVIQYGLGLKVDNVPLYYGSICLVSIVFISIVQFLMVHLKDVGKLLSIVMLILQLTSCGGTFPMETVPKLFNKLFPFMPMTYSVALFKQSITSPDSKEVLYNGGVLFGILVVFMASTIILSVVKSRRAARATVIAPVQFES
jgi:YhgE/Pip N-terminal domain/YhgE/Pip C-terminal domain